MLADLLRRGHTVLGPIGASPRYDFVVDLDGCFLRVQVKTGMVSDGAIEFATSSLHWSETSRGQRRPYHGEADVFACYCPAIDQVYYVSVATAGRRVCNLRLDPARNGQQKGVRWAHAYQVFPPVP